MKVLGFSLFAIGVILIQANSIWIAGAFVFGSIHYE